VNPLSDRNPIEVRQLGVVPYGDALAVQQHLHAEIVAGRQPDTILSLQHPNVLTFGKNSRDAFLLADTVRLKQLGCELFRTDRGGEITAHMPGQLVLYPLIRLSSKRLMPRMYVCKLEQAIIETLKAFEIDSHRDKINPGVWVGTNKIAAIGVRIKDQVTMHGLALNVSNAFDLYDLIVPCGIRERGVTSISKELGAAPSIDDVSELLCGRLKEILWEC
jgi:lipoate-protein ligase B